ncbi:MAG TPA: PD-(D/E)XK nuclease family protein [Bryobacteraceae bacterium]|nr:PD-(D/E)XK nuclease family protein [Bryobacteraceae bacterium]
MRLLTGPAGSGKTAVILHHFRESLRAGNQAIRLLVPTATLTTHLQNRLAREGFVFPGKLIQTLSDFVKSWVEGPRRVTDAVLYLIVETAARRVARSEFASVVHMPGFVASLARTINEFSSVGCDSNRLASCLPDTPLGPAFLAVYQEVDRELARRGLALRVGLLANAARRISRNGLGGIQTVWLDGFHALSDPELSFLATIGRHADLTLTFDAMDSRLAAIGFREERLPRARTTPARLLVKAPSIEREAEEIARRILEQAAAGRPFREMAIIVRSKETYVPIFRSTLARFGIPARFYFEPKLHEHSIIRFLSGTIDALLGGWDHSRTLAALRLAPQFASSEAMDRFDFAVRRQTPNSGLPTLRALSGDDSATLTPLFESLAALEAWLPLELKPGEWADRLKTLRTLLGESPVPIAAHEPAIEWRSRSAALNSFDEAMDEAAEAWDEHRQLSLTEFWRAAKSVLRLNPLRLEDKRRNVVHVLSAPEARQWVLPVVFVCGMVEKEFPQFHRQNPFFPEAARARLNQSGVRMPTAAEFEREERALFESAITRATLLVTLSYPEFNSRGDQNLPSMYLEDLVLPMQDSCPVRPHPRLKPGPPEPVEIRTPALLNVLRQRTAVMSPSALESFLQCPFQHFSKRILRLQPAPTRPEERLDFLTQGNIVHAVLAKWWLTREPLEPLFERHFQAALKEKCIPPGYHTERLRNAMLENLLAFASSDKWPRGRFQSRIEEPFTFALDDSLVISGKMDRLDIGSDGSAFVIDYKYSGPQRTKERLTNDNLLQAPLYLMAAEQKFLVKPSGMYYIGLKGGIVYAGWNDGPAAMPYDGEPFPQGWLENSGERTLRVVEQIRAGRIEVAPANTDNCRFCDSRDICRVDAHEAPEAETASEA